METSNDTAKVLGLGTEFITRPVSITPAAASDADAAENDVTSETSKTAETGGRSNTTTTAHTAESATLADVDASSNAIAAGDTAEPATSANTDATVNDHSGPPDTVLTLPPGASILHHKGQEKHSDDTETAVALPKGPKPWLDLPLERRPPLLQNLAPQFPFDAAVYSSQRKRKGWRLAWYPYAKDLQRTVQDMLHEELAKDSPNQEYVRAYSYLIRSIKEDIDDVMRQNADIRVDTLLIVSTQRITHSYLSYSAEILGEQQTKLEEYLGEDYGMSYPSDGFREILHYRTIDEQPTGFSAKLRTWTLYLLAFYWLVTLAMVLALANPLIWRLFELRGGAAVTAPYFPFAVSGTASTPTSVPRQFLQQSTPLEFKVSGTMKLFKATDLN